LISASWRRRLLSHVLRLRTANECDFSQFDTRELAVGRVKRLGGRGEASHLVLGLFGLLELGGGEWLDGAGVHADLCDLLDHGHLASFGLP